MLAASVVRLGQAVQPIINLLRDELFDSQILLGGETTVQFLKEPGRAPQTKRYIWDERFGCPQRIAPASSDIMITRNNGSSP